MHLNKILPWLSIRSKLIIAFVGLSTIPLGLVGLHSIFSNVRMMERIAIENLNHDVLTIRENTANFLGNIESDLRVLRNSSFVDRYITAVENSKDNDVKPLLGQIQAELLAFARTKLMYYQIRMVDREGNELLRIEANDVTEIVPDFHVVSDSELRRNRESFYFLLVEHLTRDQIAFAPSELVDQHNRCVPIISFATPLIGPKGSAGILIANVFARSLFRVIETKRHLPVDGKIVLVSHDGHYLYHSEKKKDWNRLLASREEDNLRHEYPASVISVLLSGGEGIITEGIDEIISYAPLFPVKKTINSKEFVAGFALPYFVIESVPRDIIMEPVYSFARMFAGFLAMFLTVAIGLGLLATRQFTKPIAELHRGAEIISKGNYNHRIHVVTHDEIEKLADQFNAMAASLESHEKELQRHRTRLEEMVEQRTFELTEEKTKLQAILDNVPSAVVLLDRDFRIQTASAAFSAITNRNLEEVKGRNCYTLFGKNGFCRECVCRRAMVTKTIENHIDHTTDQKGRERFIEHVAIPMRENGDVNSILEIITDITDRKRFEQHLLQAERLVAAGEMSAIIAHEFRNSLTSIKMILQLQNESERLSRSEKRSLTVALNSIDHMELIVKELLDFARPKPMEFRLQSLNKIVNDSLALAQLHMDKHRIEITKTLDPALPPFSLDEAHFKEALINLLLNAAQAINSNQDSKGSDKLRPPDRTTSVVRAGNSPACPPDSPASQRSGWGRAGRQGRDCGEIHIITKKIHLLKTLRDFVFTDDVKKSVSNELGHEIILKRGTECTLLEIQDTGCGIDPIHFRRIFDPFFTTKPYGTGLGLPMVKRTVNAHGGLVAVNNNSQGGATFRIYLPITHG